MVGAKMDKVYWVRLRKKGQTLVKLQNNITKMCSFGQFMNYYALCIKLTSCLAFFWFTFNKNLSVQCKYGPRNLHVELSCLPLLFQYFLYTGYFTGVF